MLAVTPSDAVGVDVSFGALPEGDCFRRFEALLSPFSAARIDRVYSPFAARLQRLGARFLKAVEREWTKAHPTRPPIDHKAQNPVFCALSRDPQIEPAAIRIHARAFRPLNLQCCQAVGCPRHSPTLETQSASLSTFFG